MLTLTRSRTIPKFDNIHGIFGRLESNIIDGDKIKILTHEKPEIKTKVFPGGSPYDSLMPAGKYFIKKEVFKRDPHGVYCLYNQNNNVYLHKTDTASLSDMYGAIFTSSIPQLHAGPVICIGTDIVSIDGERALSQTNQAFDKLYRFLNKHPEERELTITWDK
mgnify:FL=1